MMRTRFRNRLAAGALLLILLGAAAPQDPVIEAGYRVDSGERQDGQLYLYRRVTRLDDYKALRPDTEAPVWIVRQHDQLKGTDVWASSADCPAVLKALGALPLPRPRIDGRPPAVDIRQAMQAIDSHASYSLRTPGEGFNESVSWTTADPAASLGLWVNQTLAALKPCMNSRPPPGY